MSEDETPQPPTQRLITLKASWPFVKFDRTPESRREHGLMFLLMSVVTAGLVVNGDTALSAATAFIAGYALNNWMCFPKMVGGDA